MEDFTNIPAEIEDDDDYVSPIAQILADCRKRYVVINAPLITARSAFSNAISGTSQNSKNVLEIGSFLAYRVGNCLFTFLEDDGITTLQMWEVRRAKAWKGVADTWNRTGELLLTAGRISTFPKIGLFDSALSDGFNGQPDPLNVEEYDRDPVKYWQKWYSNQASTPNTKALMSVLMPQLAPLANAMPDQPIDLEATKQGHIEQIEAQRALESNAKQFTFEDLAAEIWRQAKKIKDEKLTIWERIPKKGKDREIVMLMTEGKKDNEIATALSIPLTTVTNGLRRLRMKYDFIPKRNR